MMKFKENAKIETSGFWDGMFDGGHIYVELANIIEGKEDIELIEKARNLLVEFKNALEAEDIIKYY